MVVHVYVTWWRRDLYFIFFIKCAFRLSIVLLSHIIVTDIESIQNPIQSKWKKRKKFSTFEISSKALHCKVTQQQRLALKPRDLLSDIEFEDSKHLLVKVKEYAWSGTLLPMTKKQQSLILRLYISLYSNLTEFVHQCNSDGHISYKPDSVLAACCGWIFFNSWLMGFMVCVIPVELAPTRLDSQE